uniref:Mannitol_dh_C domain-containing protein n=1 Tax=Dracunculus medinensis TaxID=318479 RepID=A0A0N4U5L8_DRAME
LFIEKQFTVEGFLNGAIQINGFHGFFAFKAANICGTYISDGKWNSLKSVMTDDAIEKVRRNFNSFTDEERELMRFSLDDVVSSFIFSSSIISRNFIRGLIARSIHPLGAWRIIEVNFFDFCR